MKKILIATILMMVVLSAGCAGIGNSPSFTVEQFVSEFENENYDACYGLMSSEYKVGTNLAAFVSICKDVNPEKYEFIEITKEYIDQDTAVVDVLVNESSVALKFSLKEGLEVDKDFEEITKQIDLVKQEDEWKITEFPYALT